MIRIACGIFAVLLIGAVIIIKRPGKAERQYTEAEESSAAVELPDEDITINGISIKGLDFEQAVEAVIKPYNWKMAVAYEEETVSLPNFIEVQARELLGEICQNKKGGEYTLDFTGMEEMIGEEAAKIAKEKDVKPKASTLESFDVQSGKFVFSQGSAGKTLNQEKLADDIQRAIESEEYDAVIKAEIDSVSPESDQEAQKKYETLATFTTTTTSNAKRNTNVRLAAEALNGTIVKPGEEFSFNKVVGQRTEEKGYQAASAYNSGEVVQEIGGGVCQMSSTLYRVAFRAGMDITYRRSHTFEPNYVTPGQDATISWDMPDFRFVNTSEGAIGIRASYSNQKATVSIYGISPLEEGVSWDLYSEKVKDTDVPAPEYVEDPTLDPGTEKVEKAGSAGSTWVTYKVISKDGKEVERVKDHEKTYKGHAPVIRRNTGDTKLSPDETEPTEETPSPTVDGMPEDYVPGQGDGESGSESSSGGETNGTAPAEKPSSESPSDSGSSSGETMESPSSPVSAGPEGAIEVPPPSVQPEEPAGSGGPADSITGP